MKIRFFLIIGILGAAFLSLGLWTGLDYYTYYGTTDQTIVFTCDYPTTGGTAVSYDWRVYHAENKVYVLEGNTNYPGSTEIQLPKTGHYIIEARARNAAGVSEWVKSTDSVYARVDGQPRAWWIYGHVAGPGPIIIN